MKRLLLSAALVSSNALAGHVNELARFTPVDIGELPRDSLILRINELENRLSLINLLTKPKTPDNSTVPNPPKTSTRPTEGGSSPSPVGGPECLVCEYNEAADNGGGGRGSMGPIGNTGPATGKGGGK